MEDLNRDVLGVSVSAEGSAHLRRLASGTKWTLSLGVLMCFLFLANSAVWHLNTVNIAQWRKTNLPFYIELKLQPVYAVFLAVFDIFQLYLLFRFSRQSDIACQAADSQSFNESLRLLGRYNRIVQLTILLSLVFGLLELSGSLIFYSQIRH